MKGTILTILFMFIGTICVNAQFDSTIKYEEKLKKEKALMDSSYSRMINESLSYEERLENRDMFNKYKESYERHLRRYNRLYNVDPSNINRAGYYLERSANYQIATLCVSFGGGLLTGLLANSMLNEKDPDVIDVKRGLCIGAGVITGCVILGLHIASLIDKKNAGKILQNIQITGNGLSYTF